jgi:hypothetical protein
MDACWWEPRAGCPGSLSHESPLLVTSVPALFTAKAGCFHAEGIDVMWRVQGRRIACRRPRPPPDKGV